MATGLTPDWPEIRTPTGVLTSPLVERIRQGIIGEGELMDGPFGPRRVTYADDTASGRSLDFLEDFIREQVLPRYANTHTESSGTGLATTRLREDARRIIRDAAGGTADDLVIFCGSGATAAVNKLIGILELRIPAGLDERYEFSRSIPEAERPVVFVGPYEHHSNELPWRESIAEVVVIGEDAGGHIDVADLDRQLRAHADRPLLIGSFSAASNVTGILTDADAVAVLLHAHGALSFWDYAAAGPYLPIRVSASPRAPAITRTRCSCPRTSSPAARRHPASWSCGATWSATRSLRSRAGERWRSSIPSATGISTTRSHARRAAPPPSWNRSGPGWSSRSSRRSVPA